MTNRYVVTITLFLLIGFAFLWFQSSKDYQAKLNDLYTNGLAVTGEVADVLDNNLNEGNIHSWDVYYHYWDTDSTRRTGKINESKEKTILVGDSIYVIYSRVDAEFHVASLNKVTYEKIGILSAMLRIDNMWILAPVLLLGIVFLAQVIYLYRTRDASC